MKKIENIIDTCKKCKYCKQFDNAEKNDLSAYVCYRTKPNSITPYNQLIKIDYYWNNVEIPSWCPLETYNDIEHKTVMLNGLEWMTENLTGHGGTEVDGNWYYTWEQAKKAAEEIGNGWRLPTGKEFEAFHYIKRAWDFKKKGCLFDNKLFLNAAGSFRWSPKPSAGGKDGYYWSSSLYSVDPEAMYLHLAYSEVYTAYGNKWNGFLVRLVRDIK